jgi:hypothetical protein
MPTLSTCLQPLPKDLCATCGHHFTLWRLTHHQCFCQASNPSNLNLHDHLGPIPSFTPNPPTSPWAWVSKLDVFGVVPSSLSSYSTIQLYPYRFTMWCTNDFCFPLNKLAHDPYDVAARHLFLLLPQWCLILSLRRGAIGHREMKT